MPLAHPEALRAGDLIALVSPAGPLAKSEIVDQCREAIEALGYRVWTGESAKLRTDYLAGTDEQRAADLNHAFRTKEIRGILCTRGGYGSGRLLPLLDWRAAAADPKIFGGFSDLTCIHAALFTQANMASLHTATIASALVSESDRLTDEARAVFLKHLTSTEPVGSIREAMKWTDPWVLRGGMARGVLVGGNLSNVAALVGTKYLPPPDGKILFIEEVGEEPYRIDRMINQLDQCGYLGAVEGIILGQFTNAEPTDPKREKIDVVLPRLLSHLNVPILGNFPAGHVPRNAALPMGCEAVLDADAGDVVLTEALAR